MKLKQFLPILICSLITTLSFAQSGTVRGNIYDEDSGEPIIYGNVYLEGTDLGTNTDFDGFFTMANVPVGKYTLVAKYIGYDSIAVEIEVADKGIVYKNLNMTTGSVNLGVVNVSGRKEAARTQVQISKVTVTPKQIRALPSTGGEADIAQYLTVLPGVIVSGDQGGQLYIRGGSPVQNKILLDGMIIYNPYHSIGFFSVFETETIRNVDVLTGGFNAEHGGRTSAVVDIQTREGNKKRFGGLVSASPFQAKALFEGPLKKLEEGSNGGSSSFLITAKHSYLDETSKVLYDYAVDTSFFSFAAGDTTLSDIDDIGLPYTYTDIYAKLSFLSGNGSKLNLFGFNFVDRFNFAGIVDLGWDSFGAGMNFTLVPPRSNFIMDGTIAYSDYDITLIESDGDPRNSQISNTSVALNFTYFGYKKEVKYGFEFNGFNTDFSFKNSLGVTSEQKGFTTELSGYVKYKQEIGNLIIEPGLRLQIYASQSTVLPEPRLGIKYNITDFLRFKAAGGFYSQNLISTVNDLDVVNFFVGFLAGPEEALFEPNSTTKTDNNLQRAIHGVAGFEADVTDRIEVNVEPYYKRFTQLININRNKIDGTDPDFVTETGDAYGIDFSVRYEGQKAYIWATYSLSYVNRDDGLQEYPTIFDRRHNVNFLGTYTFGADNAWEASIRWNLGSGFPFTQTQGFYENVSFEDIIFTDILTGNFDLETLLSDELNGGRLSFYHRLDGSLKRTFKFSKNTHLDIIASVTNIYDRDNIFFVDRVSNNRVDQLPILPSLGITFGF